MNKSRRSNETGSDRHRRSESAAAPELEERSFDRDRIAERAYQRYEERGRGDGQDLDDWLEAERELHQPDTGSSRGDSGTSSSS